MGSDAAFLHLLPPLGLPIELAAAVFVLALNFEAATNALVCIHAIIQLLALNLLALFVWNAFLLLPIASSLLARSGVFRDRAQLHVPFPGLA